MIHVRRALAVVCILAIVAAGVTSTASELLTFVLVPLDPLFGGVIVVRPVLEAAAVPLRPAPALSVRSPRAPPVV